MVKNLPTYVYFKGYRLLSNRDICTPLSYKENKHSTCFPIVSVLVPMQSKN